MTFPLGRDALKQQSKPRSRCLLHWRAQDGLEAITGQALTFDRNGRGGSIVGVNGMLGSNYESYDAPRLCAIDVGTRQWDDVGLLLEDAATNLCLRSEEFDNATWSKVQYTASGNTTLTRGPNGAFTADYLDETAINANHRIAQTITIVSADYVAVSIFLKARVRTGVRLLVTDNATGLDGFAAYFNLLTGTVSSPAGLGVGAIGYSEIVPLPNGWYECRIGGRVNGGHTVVGLVVMGWNGSATSYTGVVGQGFFAWGAQFYKSAAGITYQSYLGPTDGSTRSSTLETLVCSLPTIPRLTPNLTFYVKSARPWYAKVTTTPVAFPRALHWTFGSAYIRLVHSQGDPDNGAIDILDDAAGSVAAYGATPGMPAGAYAEIVGQVEGLSTGIRCRSDWGSGFGAWSSNIGKIETTGSNLYLGNVAGSPWLAPIVCVKIASGLFTVQQMREMF